MLGRAKQIKISEILLTNNSGSFNQEEEVLNFSVLPKLCLDVQLLPTTSLWATFEDTFCSFLVPNMFVPFCSRRAASAL